jgi:hypothetical protein
MNVSLDETSQYAHVGWGYLLTTLPVLVFHKPVWWFAGSVIVAAGIKEYADAHGLETPDVAGNSWKDFAFWSVGVVTGILACKML